jgi:hypothetical protein
VKMTRLSCHRFRSNEVRLWLSVIAYNLGKPLAAAGIAAEDQQLVADEFTAKTGEDGRTAGETCPLLLAAVGGEPPDETVVWQYARADSRAVPSGGIAEALGAGKSMQSQKRTEGCLTKPDGKAAVSSFGTRVGADGTLSRALGPSQKCIAHDVFIYQDPPFATELRQRHPSRIELSGDMAERPGVEPRFSGSEPDVLPVRRPPNAKRRSSGLEPS